MYTEGSLKMEGGGEQETEREKVTIEVGQFRSPPEVVGGKGQQPRSGGSP